MIILRNILAISRLLLFSVGTLLILSFLLVSNLLYRSKAKRVERGIVYRQAIIRYIHLILGSHITVSGKLPEVPGLIVSNHRSYFDSLVILKDLLAYPIAKKEVASWLIIGSVCKSTGVIFIDRNNQSQRKLIRKEVRNVLENDFSILNTPEGTTHIEPTTIAFKKGAFIMAAELNKPVIPVAIDYKYLSDAWIGDDSFLPHFLKCFGKWRTHIKVSYLDPVYSNHADELIEKSKSCIDRELLKFRKEWDSENKS